MSDKENTDRAPLLGRAEERQLAERIRSEAFVASRAGQTARLLAIADDVAGVGADRHGPCICNTGPGTDGPDEWCPTHGRPYDDVLAWGDRQAARAYIAELELQRLREGLKALHVSGDGDGFCDACGTCWPCPTSRLLGGEQA